MYILSPSILAADFKKLGAELEAVTRAGAGYIHIDVMDGMFVPSISYGMPVIKSIRSATDALFDVHMMVEDPDRYVDAMKAAGADSICVHQEAVRHLDRTISHIHELGMKAAVAVNPATNICVLDNVLETADMFLIMTVNPGFGAQKLIPYTIGKVKALRAKLNEMGLEKDIEVDGGVRLDNAKEFLDAGANVLVAGSAVFGDHTEENAKKFVSFLEGYRP